MTFLYASTIALSAFLLFVVQPMIAKVILPWFGGSAAVWTTALMFFQVTLLAGYIYSHLITRYLTPKRQAAAHIFLLALSLATLPIIPSADWKTSFFGDPTFRIILLLGQTVGLPYFLLSTTGPLLQSWYVADRARAMPYRMFAISNAGSVLGLLCFPFALEPFLTTRTQAIGWSVGYAFFVVLCAGVALRAGSRAASALAESDEPAPSVELQVLWVALAACASALLLSITNYLTQNVAPIPFLWVLTLAIYLLTFIICFETDKIYRRNLFFKLLAIVLGSMAYAIYLNYGNLEIKVALIVFSVSLFICCMVCHGELAALKPHPRYLTRYYLMVALGGALGGLYVAVAAPHIYSTSLELPTSLVFCAALAAIVAWNQSPLLMRVVYALAVAGLSGYLAFNQFVQNQEQIASARNFYGVLRVNDQLENDEKTPMRKLLNGTIIHGIQLTAAASKREPTSYYGGRSGVGRAILLLQKTQPEIKVGVVGLGAGVIASYCRPGDTFRFYEINPLDVEMANRYFTFLKGCTGKCEIVPGDARLSLEHEAPQQYDLLAIDAFSSDAIPIHLLTREAFGQYFRHIRRGGILAVHITNRYLNLEPVVARASEEYGRPAFEVSDDGEQADYISASDWMLVGPDTQVFVLLGFNGAPIVRRGAPKDFRTWTDDFSNLYSILK